MRGILALALVLFVAAVASADETKETRLNQKVSDWHKIAGHGEVYFEPGDVYEHDSRMMRTPSGQKRYPVKRDSRGQMYVEGIDAQSSSVGCSNCYGFQNCASPSCPNCPTCPRQPAPNYQPPPSPYYLPPPVAPRYQPAPHPYYQPAPNPYYQPAPNPYYQPAPNPYYQPSAPYYPMPYYNGPQPRYLEDLYGINQPRDPMSEKKTGERVCPACGAVSLGADLVKTENANGELVIVGCHKCLGVSGR